MKGQPTTIENVATGRPLVTIAWDPLAGDWLLTCGSQEHHAERVLAPAGVTCDAVGALCHLGSVWAIAPAGRVWWPTGSP